MLLRLFIKAIDYDDAKISINSVLSNIEKSNIKRQTIKIEPYWKSDEVIVGEINLELYELLGNDERDKFLKQIAVKWLFFDNDEVLSSNTIEENKLRYNLEMANIFFD